MDQNPAMPFFSVVIPLYNKEKFIKATLQSVANQTFSNFEVIIVDDASTDSSSAIAQTFSSGSVSIIRHPKNKGLSAARNTGIKAANANFIAFIDSDDVWKTDFLEKMHQMILRFPEAGIYGAGYEEVYADGLVVDIDKNIDLKPGKMTIISDFFAANAHQPIFCYSSVVVKKEVFETVGYFDENITLGEDVDFNIRAASQFQVAYYNAIGAGYTIFSENQITNSAIADKTITDFNKYEPLADKDPSLKKYLDVNRYILAMSYKMAGEHEASKKLVLEIDRANLTLRQILLLSAPIWVVKIFREIKANFLKKGVRLTTFRG